MKKLKLLLYSLMAMSVAALSLTSCGNDNDEPSQPSLTDGYVGEYSGKMTLSIAGQYDYETDIRVKISRGDNETISVAFPEYSLSNTMMGDITLGGLTLDNLIYDSSKVYFNLSYGEAGKKQYFKSQSNGKVTMDGYYDLTAPSEITVAMNENGTVTIVNSFRIGSMPMPITATFTGRK